MSRLSSRTFDPNLQAQCQCWMEEVIGEPFDSSLTFALALKNGQLLCQLANKIRPGSIKKIEVSTMPFKQMENISNFLKSCRLFGVPEHDLFETVDLFEGSISHNIHTV